MEPVLRYVMAHKILHVLEGVNRHPDNGVMKALDVVLIHTHFTARTVQMKSPVDRSISDLR